MTGGGRRWENRTVDGVGGVRRVAHTDDALWLMKLVRRTWSSSAGVSCEAGKQRCARRAAACSGARGAARAGAARRGRGGRSGRLQLLSPKWASVVHGIDQGAGLVDRELLGAGGTSAWVPP